MHIVLNLIGKGFQFIDAHCNRVISYKLHQLNSDVIQYTYEDFNGVPHEVTCNLYECANWKLLDTVLISTDTVSQSNAVVSVLEHFDYKVTKDGVVINLNGNDRPELRKLSWSKEWSVWNYLYKIHRIGKHYNVHFNYGNFTVSNSSRGSLSAPSYTDRYTALEKCFYLNKIL